MQANRIPILCTKAIDPSLIQVSENAGYALDIIPFITIEAIHSNELRERIQRLSTTSTTVVITSMNAAEQVIAKLAGVIPGWKIFCIGLATQRSVVTYFGENAISGTAKNASTLAQLIVDTGNIRNVVFFCGDQRRDDLPSVLTRENIEVEEIIVYRTLLLTNKIEKAYKGILFFSPSAVTSYFKNNTVSDDAVLFAIGETTAGSIKSFCNNTVIVSPVPDQNILIQKLVEYHDEIQGLPLKRN